MRKQAALAGGPPEVAVDDSLREPSNYCAPGPPTGERGLLPPLPSCQTAKEAQTQAAVVAREPADELCLLQELPLFVSYTSTFNHRNAQARCTIAR